MTWDPPDDILSQMIPDPGDVAFTFPSSSPTHFQFYHILDIAQFFLGRCRTTGTPPFYLLGCLTRTDRVRGLNDYEIIGDSCDVSHGLPALHRPSRHVYHHDYGVDPSQWRLHSAWTLFHKIP